MTRSIALRIFLIAITLCITAPTYAFKLIPIKADFSPTGRDSSQIFKLENDSDKAIAVQISALHRQVDIDGKESYQNADDDFIIFPPQMVISPHKTQTVRVQWAGDVTPELELPYRLVAEQLPIALERVTTKGAHVSLLMRYLGAIYIVPDDATPNIVVGSIEKEQQEDGSHTLTLMVENKGTAHAVLGNLSVQLPTGRDIKGVSETIVLTPSELDGMNGENILAGHQRRFSVPWPNKLDAVPDTAELEFTPWR